mmetsp:Transcript_3414/g.9877  ORF Transcript_3414/g.9877 Transcript_3414/m.9877 type:complete len:137 (-) Transcript_3414:3082-3492(-)
MPGEAAAAPHGPAGCSDARRFELELEFVQCLASPDYLNWLAQSGTLNNPALVNFLDYLQYWLRPEYSTYIIYPHCLFFLELLQSEEFRKALASTAVKDLVHSQQFFFWQHYRANRSAAAAAAPATPHSAPSVPPQQ